MNIADQIELNMKSCNIPIFIFDIDTNHLEMILVDRLSLLKYTIFLKLTPTVSKNIEVPLKFNYGYMVKHNNGENAQMNNISQQEINTLKSIYFTSQLTRSRGIDKPHKKFTGYRPFEATKSRFAPKMLQTQ
jgi:hypothetical protein